VADTTPQDRLADLMAGFWTTQAVYVAAKLGIADLLATGPRTADDLATATGTHPHALYRLLRALAGLGIFAEEPDGRFTLTPLAECLRDVPGSLRALALMRGEWQYQAWGQLLHSVRTGQPAFDALHGMPLFDWLAQKAEAGRIFDAAMTGVHGRETDAMLDAFDFSGIGTLADIGGGNGSVLCAVLERYPAMTGILFDLPAVGERAKSALAAAGLGSRCRVEVGSFFDVVPTGGDAYLLRHIIHDWDDERSIAILRKCRQAMGPAGRLFVVEGVVPTGNEPSVSKRYDLSMLVMVGGMERTETEYRSLFAAAGFRLNRIVPTRTWVSVIEGVPAS
jgi:hypothetical protein